MPGSVIARLVLLSPVVAFWIAVALLAKRKLPPYPYLNLFRFAAVILIVGWLASFISGRETIGDLLQANGFAALCVSTILQKKAGEAPGQLQSLNLSSSADKSQK